MVKALTQEQKLFLQRIMAVKVLSDEEAKGLYEEIMTLSEGRGTTSVDGFDRFIGTISSHLKEYFDLDIRTAVIFHEASGPSMSSTTRYHAFVNRVNDTPAELYGAFNKSPHEIALFKIILERLVERGKEKEDDNEEDNDCDSDDGTSNHRRGAKAKTNTSPVAGCTGSLSIMEMLSLRSELTESHEGKLTLQQTQDAIDKLIQEKWLVPNLGSKEDGISGRRSSSASTSSKKRRGRKSSAEEFESTGATYQIGPRTYMELDMVLRDMGLSNMPQFITLRSS
jgi:hypothetical protein